MKVRVIDALQTRLMLASALLVTLIVSALLWRLITDEQEAQVRELRVTAETVARLLVDSQWNEIDDQNPAQIRLSLDQFMRHDLDLV